MSSDDHQGPKKAAKISNGYSSMSEICSGSSPRSMSPSSKCGQCTVRANDIMMLIFYDSHDHSELEIRPEYTHQLFDEEEVTFLSNPDDAEVNIFVNTSNLKQAVSFSSCFTQEEIKQFFVHMQPALPTDAKLTTSNTGEDAFAGRQSAAGSCEPPGECIQTFKVGKDLFEVFLATSKDSGAPELMSRAEKLAYYFIETADCIDFSDNRWEVLFLFRKSPLMGKHSFVGYTTLFSFNNPFVGTNLRVCQALVLPGYQGLGLGQRLLKVVYSLARSRSDVSEVTVEEPCVGFQRMRDRVDYEWCVQYMKKQAKSGSAISVSDAGATAGPAVDALARALKITKAQTQFCLEAQRFVMLLSDPTNGSSSRGDKENSGNRGTAAGRNSPDSVNSTTQSYLSLTLGKRSSSTSGMAIKQREEKATQHLGFKEFRLMIKRRFVQYDKELKSMDKADMQKELSTMFEEEMQRFLSVSKAAL